MGSKKRAKEEARKLEIPVVPSYEGPLATIQKEADRLGFPLVIKATMGGGGKGMRVVNTLSEFQSAIDACQREAQSSFGDGDIFLEKYIPFARHIEVQIFGDQHGNVVHLFERDCSLQRRHQKIIEEAPSSLPLPLKKKLYAAALKLARSIQYENAGTVEFLVDREGNYYFMEMNPRLQVEHPVTEMITGIDLVEWQFRVASNEKLPLSQDKIVAKGHGIELRRYGEDPVRNFKSTVGKVWTRSLPKEGRMESGLKEMDTLTPYYDSLLGKLIVGAKTRPEALAKAKKSLREWEVLGVMTNASLLKNLLQDKKVIQNQIDAAFIDRHISKLAPSSPPPDEIYKAASLIQVLSPHEMKNSPWEQNLNWRLDGNFPFTFEWSWEEHKRKISLISAREGWTFDSLKPSIATLSEDILFWENLDIPYWKQGNKISLIFKGDTYNLTLCTHDPHQVISQKREAHLRAPLSGKVSAIFVSVGERVKEGQPLLVLEAMKMEHEITAPRHGRVKRIFYQVGSLVEEGAEVIDLKEGAKK